MSVTLMQLWKKLWPRAQELWDLSLHTSGVLLTQAAADCNCISSANGPRDHQVTEPGARHSCKFQMLWPRANLRLVGRRVHKGHRSCRLGIRAKIQSLTVPKGWGPEECSRWLEGESAQESSKMSSRADSRSSSEDASAFMQKFQSVKQSQECSGGLGEKCTRIIEAVLQSHSRQFQSRPRHSCKVPERDGRHNKGKVHKHVRWIASQWHQT